jgi:hypothetical protein
MHLYVHVGCHVGWQAKRDLNDVDLHRSQEHYQPAIDRNYFIVN